MKHRFSVWILLCLLLLNGCSENWDEFGMEYTGGHAQNGGDLAQLRRISQDGVETITLSFAYSEPLPQYRIGFTEAPHRMVVSLGGASASAFTGSSILNDAFLLAGEENTVYVHIGPASGVEVTERGSDVIIRFKKKDGGRAAYYRYAQGEPAADLTPTLCDDGKHIGYLSRPYADEADASAAATAGEYIITLQPGQLPEYIQSEEEAHMAEVMSALGGLNTNAFAVGRRFLCSWQDGDTVLMVEEGSSKLLLSTKGTERQLKVEPDFALGITAAQSTQKGDGLLLLTGGGELSTLYRYDLKNDSLKNLSALGMGQNVLCTAVGESAVYAYGGGGIYSCDEAGNVVKLTQTTVDLPSLGYCQGSVYFCDLDGGEEYTFYRLKEDGTRMSLGFADGFTLGKTGQAALLRRRMLKETLPCLTVLDVNTGSETTLVEKGIVKETVWTQDGSTLYYTLTDADENSILYRYVAATGGIEKLGGIGKGSIAPMGDGLCISQTIGGKTVLYRYHSK